ncbi:MAG: hypothetical protein M1829_004716 [Trizodia sp. TS-e1964]|nr:MAG: hypothetical protein M1829_004716 [Trizodia sp. TS-e1964]
MGPSSSPRSPRNFADSKNSLADGNFKREPSQIDVSSSNGQPPIAPLRTSPQALSLTRPPVAPVRLGVPYRENSRAELEQANEHQSQHLPFRNADSALEVPRKLPTGPPPPINRADKPIFFSKPSTFVAPKDNVGLAPADPSFDFMSPFSSPPSSDDNPENTGSQPIRSKKANGTPEPKSTADSRMQPDSHLPLDDSHQQRVSHQPAMFRRVVDPRKLGFSGSRESKTAQETQIIRGELQTQLSHLNRKVADPRLMGLTSGNIALGNNHEIRPELPPRRATQRGDYPGSDILSRTRSQSPARITLDSPSATAALVADSTSRFLPPPKRFTSLTNPTTPTSYNTRAESSGSSHSQVPYASLNSTPPSHAETKQQKIAAVDYEVGNDQSQLNSLEYPDSSLANRRAPCFSDGAREIDTIFDTRLMAICGNYVSITGFHTKAWDLTTGAPKLGLSHGDTTKVVSLVFKPSCEIDKEGDFLWLGTNQGDILEVDIPHQTTTYLKPNVHGRREVIRLHRHASEIWSIDDDGKLLVWLPDRSGTPSLRNSPESYRVPKGHNFSIVVGHQLWLAVGRDIRVYCPSRNSGEFYVLDRPLNQPGVGDITSGTIVSSCPDQVFFGHADGKITTYSTKDYSCISVTNVSLYKINSLSGVGDFLWAGFNTGMIYVYDTQTTPWKVKKDWHAHINPIVSLSVNKISIWKHNRIQVASLGIDNRIKIWDGMLQDDWLETEMHTHDTEYCSFREITAKVVTWNAGASKPHNSRDSSRDNSRDGDFIREIIESQSSPDILVFGFQELVDLEDHTVTAKSLFKSSKKKDQPEEEHMSRVYVSWRNYLTSGIERCMPYHQQYQLLHTASLVGLFTCVYVKSSERANIRNINISEVKRGMGGRYGNKGALVMRFIMDDSSICFINCHLAAGQTQTSSRNNDINSILESAILPPESDVHARTDMFVGGGDGSLILDHEICILNGDLNYRIDAMNRETVIKAIQTGDLAKLLKRDQLLLSRRRNPGFRLRAFKELPITFNPTYKYDVGTDSYDTSEKKRSPAWCDRILYRGLGCIKQLEYRRHELRASDHRPVSADFTLRLKTISRKHQDETWAQSVQSFEEVKKRLSEQAKLDYLMNVCGYSPSMAKKFLMDVKILFPTK